MKQPRLTRIPVHEPERGWDEYLEPPPGRPERKQTPKRTGKLLPPRTAKPQAANR